MRIGNEGAGDIWVSRSMNLRNFANIIRYFAGPNRKTEKPPKGICIVFIANSIANADIIWHSPTYIYLKS